MRRWRWIIHGNSKPIVINVPGEIRFEDPRTDALKAMAEALQAQAAVLERMALTAESVAAVLERAERRTLGVLEEEKGRSLQVGSVLPQELKTPLDD